MGKFLRSEIKESSKYFVYMILGNVVFSGLIAYIIGQDFDNITNNSNQLLTSLSFLAAFAILVALFVGFIYIVIGSYRRDLYNNSSYLKFSLPISGSQYIRGKLYSVYFWSAIMLIITIVTNVLIFYFLFNAEVSQLFRNINFFGNNILSMIIVLIYYIFLFVTGIISLYFCITFVKAVFKNSKKGYSWIAIYFILSAINSVAIHFIQKYLPYYLALGSKIAIVEIPYGKLTEFIGKFTLMPVNLFTVAYTLITTLILYSVSIYLLDHKVDI